MKRHAILILLLLSGFLSILFGQNSQKKQYTSFNIEEVLGKKKTVLLSDIVKSINYVRLETREDIVLGTKNVRVTPIDDYLFISQSDQPLIVFDKNGKFIRRIGKMGIGPTEYSNNYSISIDQIGKRIFILNSQRGSILNYSWEGVYLNEIVNEKPILEFEYIGNNLFCGCLKIDGLLTSSDYNYIIFNDKGKTIKGFHFPGNANRTLHSSYNGRDLSTVPVINPYFSSSPSGVNINTFQNDSLFTATKDGEIIPTLTWNLGKYKSPYLFSDMSIAKTEKEKYIGFISVVETEKYWFMRFSLQGKAYHSILEKKTKQFYEVEDNKNPLRNNLDGGPNFWPFVESYKGKIFAIPIFPTQLKKQLENGALDDSNIKFPDKNRDLKELIKAIDITDNQVIMIVELL
jgi:hypothetical protein